MEERLTAPEFDRMLMHFREGWLNASSPTLAVREALVSLFDVVDDLAPSEKNAELKRIWLVLPRGPIEDFGDFEELLESRECESYEDFVFEWKWRYPEEQVWRRQDRRFAKQSGKPDGFESVEDQEGYTTSASRENPGSGRPRP